MFFLLSILATIFYSLNNVFLAPLARSMNPLLVNSYRGVSLGITMLPLVICCVAGSEFEKIRFETIIFIIVMCLVTVAGNVSNFQAQKYLPVGVATALCLGFSTLVVMVISHFFLHENMSRLQVILAGFMLIEVFVMGMITKSNDFKGLNVPKGTLYSMLFGLFLGTGYSLVGVLSKTLNPILVGYLWEFCVGIFGFVIYFVLGYLRKVKAEIKFNEFYKVGLAASPTILGTSGYAFATTLGPIGILAAILATLGAFTALFGRLILKEKLSFAQWVVIVVLVGTLAALRLAGV
jgi:drug/metabolite transporter (DMT)-like permease